MDQKIQYRKAKSLSTALFPWYPAALNVPVSEHNDECTAGFSGLIFIFFPFAWINYAPNIQNFLQYMVC